MPCGNDGAEATTSAVLRVRCLRTSLPVSRGATAAEEELEEELDEEEEEEEEGEGFTTRTRIPK